MMRSVKTFSAAPAEAPKPQPSPNNVIRKHGADTFEQIVLAFVLALVFRTFEAEAFVIPTGSMAPTLYGRNKEMTCTQCGFELVIGASSEVTRDGNALIDGVRIEGAVCPNCRFLNRDMEQARVFNGDRILVNKFPYELGDPDRWDVFVFKYPEKPGTNYIKRLVGLPGETIRIQGGDLYTVGDDGSAAILRKPPDKQSALQIAVYAHDHASPKLDAAGWPQRWGGVVRGVDDAQPPVWNDATTGWTHDPAARSYSIAQDQAAEPQWLRYRHYAPTAADWRAVEGGQVGQPTPRLIGDFCGYNAVWGRDASHLNSGIEWSNPDELETGSFWTSDLTVSGTLRVDSVGAAAAAVFELCDGQWWYRCRIDLASGQARLVEVATHLSEQDEKELGQAATAVQGTGEWEFSFANVDDRLCVWINGDLIDFGPGAELTRTATSPQRIPQWSDLAPVGIAVEHAGASVSHLTLERDIYYRARGGGFDFHGGRLEESMGNPEAWHRHYQSARHRPQYRFHGVDDRARPLPRAGGQLPTQQRQPLLAHRASNRAAEVPGREGVLDLLAPRRAVPQRRQGVQHREPPDRQPTEGRADQGGRLPAVRGPLLPGRRADEADPVTSPAFPGAATATWSVSGCTSVPAVHLPRCLPCRLARLRSLPRMDSTPRRGPLSCCGRGPIPSMPLSRG